MKKSKDKKQETNESEIGVIGGTEEDLEREIGYDETDEIEGDEESAESTESGEEETEETVQEDFDDEE